MSMPGVNRAQLPKSMLFPLCLCCLLTSVCHCRADLFEDDEIKGLLKFRPWWTKLSPSTEQEGEAGEFKSSFYDLNQNYVNDSISHLAA